MGAVKNMLRGIGITTIYIAFTLIIPLLTFSYFYSLEIQQGIDIQLGYERYSLIVFWIVAFGLLICGCAFFYYSSPKQSIRKGIIGIIMIILNCLYIWSYKFSGATALEYEIVDYGFVSLDLSQLIMVYLGLYFLTIIIKIYDLTDFIVNRKKIREKRRSK